jgi:hypothetical protein
MGTVPSVLSKLERASEAEPEVAERYLTAVDSDLAREVLEFYARPWRQERPPSFLHPDAETLWLIDQTLRDLDAFEAENDDPVLRGPINMWRTELAGAESYLQRRDHTIAWVGDIGVGKTTALSHAVGLLVGDGRSVRRPAFPVGPGRTTVCETAIRASTTFGVLVDPEDDEEVIRQVRDLVTSLTPDATGGGVSSEVDRVLRNMSGMQEINTIVDDEPVSIDPIADLLREGVGVEEVADRMVAEMKLQQRKERQIILPEGSEDGLLWVSKLVSKINSGQDERFGLPRRITVLMPSANLSGDGQQLQIIDTRGIDSTTQRKDLLDLDDDIRALMVLCSKFADAPTATVQRMLQEAAEARSGALKNRKCILVLPRGDEALEMAGYSEPLSSRQQGYAIRRKQIEQALIKAELPKVPIYFFDARNDEPDKIWANLRGQIDEMRKAYRERVRWAADGVTNLRENKDEVLAKEARDEVEREVVRIIETVEPLPETARPAYQNLLDQMAVGHHSSIAASIARRGRWDPFHFAQILGQGVRIDGAHRTTRLVTRIEYKLDDLEQKWTAVPSVVQSLQGLRLRLADGHQEFLSAARTIGVDAYTLFLINESEAWTLSARRYGLGAGYKRDVAEIWRSRFLESEDAAATSKAVSERLQDAWSVWVLDPLREAVRSDEPT